MLRSENAWTIRVSCNSDISHRRELLRNSVVMININSIHTESAGEEKHSELYENNSIQTIHRSPFKRKEMEVDITFG